MKNEHGQVTVVILACILAGGILWSFLPIAHQMHQVQTDQINRRTSLMILRENIRTLLSSSEAIKNTINKQSAKGMPFDCFKNGTCSTVSKAFDLYDSTGNLYVSTSGTAFGFNLDGSTCKTFSNGVNRNCFIQAQLSWNPMCTSGCSVTKTNQIKVQVSFIGKKMMSDGFALNPELFSFDRVLP